MSEAYRGLDKLDPEVRGRVELFFDKLRDTFPQFKQFIITETWRSDERQRQLIRSGASKTPRSNHQDGKAVDWVPLRHSGKLDYRPAVFRNIYRVVDPRDYGLTSGAHLWNWDEGHLQAVELQGRGSDLSPQMEAYPQ